MHELNLNGLPVFHRGDTTYIALPREAWRRVEGGCSCRFCSASAKIAVPAYWDTLAVPAPNAVDGRTWTVHFPEIHIGKKAKRD